MWVVVTSAILQATAERCSILTRVLTGRNFHVLTTLVVVRRTGRPC